MRLRTLQTEASNAAKHWAEHFAKHRIGPHKLIADKLLSLGEDPTIEAVNAVLDQGHEIQLRCTECNQSRQAVIEISEDEYHAVFICGECLRKATELMRAVDGRDVKEAS